MSGIRVRTTFKYDVPDDYLSQSNKERKQGTWTYVGPRYYHVEISPAGNIIEFEPMEDPTAFRDRTIDGQEDLALSLSLDCADSESALLATICNANPDSDMADSSVFPHKSITLTNGLVYKRPDPVCPNHTYERNLLRYDSQNKVWNFKNIWKKPHVSWEDINSAISATLNVYHEAKKDSAYWDGLNAAGKKEWEDWYTETKGLVAAEKAAGHEPWHVLWRDWPNKPNDPLADSAGSDPANKVEESTFQGPPSE